MSHNVLYSRNLVKVRVPEARYLKLSKNLRFGEPSWLKLSDRWEPGKFS